jgi:hypothetical protein
MSRLMASVVIASLSMLIAAPASAQQWIRCADEGGLCALGGVAIVRYGAGERWHYQVATGNVHCNDAQFGNPAANVGKACQRWETLQERERRETTAVLQSQLEQAQQQLQELEGNERYAAQLEQELSILRRELRDLRRSFRGERREIYRPRLEFER